MRRLLATCLCAAALVGVAGPAAAGTAYYKVTVCDVVIAKNKTATEAGTYVFTGTQLPKGDYIGDCAGYGIKTTPGNRYGIAKRT